MQFSPADILYAIIIIIIIAILAGLILVSDRITRMMQLRRIRAFRASPVKRENEPVLIQGLAVSPGHTLPTSGEQVAFYALFVMTQGSNLAMAFKRTQLLPSTTAFKIFESSGDFTVIENTVPYRIEISSIVAYFFTGGRMFAEQHRHEAISLGYSETIFNEAVNFEAAIQALTKVFRISATGDSYISAIDTRVTHYQYGDNTPSGILDFIRRKGISPKPGEKISVIEFSIPQKKPLYVFGTLGEGNSIRYTSDTVSLSVSYTDPESPP
ncbi:MAG: hypothetical protein GYA23_11470 [Methanomicrobiales archaeon]|nr:hypothetical protein [Methanomicrobiales archaeon]